MLKYLLINIDPWLQGLQQINPILHLILDHHILFMLLLNKRNHRGQTLLSIQQFYFLIQIIQRVIQ